MQLFVIKKQQQVLQKLVAHSMKAGLWLFVLWFFRHSTVFETTSLSVAFGSKQEVVYRFRELLNILLAIQAIGIFKCVISSANSGIASYGHPLGCIGSIIGKVFSLKVT
ncbi:hypothetical protein EB796_022422 [Bugula neritina]|nr:hypothetical protein EB796_022422 [Bugula neritina]